MTRFPGMGPMESEGDAEAGREPESMSLLGGIAGDNESGVDAQLDTFGVEPEHTGGKLLNHGVLLIVAVALVAAGALYLMRLSQGELTSDEATAQTEAKIEQWLGKLTVPGAMSKDDPMHQQQITALFQDTGEIIQIFNTDLTGHQVPVEYVKQNPFELRLAKQEVVLPDGSAAAAAAAAREREARLSKLQREVDGLTLQSVVNMRSNPVAAINGDFYRRGDTIGSFTVAAVSAKHMAVKLTAGDDSFVLRMVTDVEKN